MRECSRHGIEGSSTHCICSDDINKGPNICRLVQAVGLYDEARISDEAFTASSAKNERFKRTFDARLNGPGAWVSDNLNSCDIQWLQIDLSVLHILHRIGTQGCKSCTQEKWVSKYVVRHSRDGNYWCFFENYGARNKEKVFDGNFDTDSIVRNDFRPPLVARMIRIYPIVPYDASGKYRSALRVELYGCKQMPVGKQAPPRSVSPFS
ncbi:unnamed protein product [Owenia fusiformis]|uniref:F5/8 type C domain-containing protein n=1 Tax=Owenia fusiformis TaxID=6347 RepID=A0A8S4PV28_OWEFU|nr:unnamed protein product [Owenia fusiformis]